MCNGLLNIYRVVSPYTYELISETGKVTVCVWHAKDIKSHPSDGDEKQLFGFRPVTDIVRTLFFCYFVTFPF